jgi:glutamyl-Q tRNA(Asp) synthetase
VANAVFVWGLARARAAEVLLRIEDHDRQRSRPEYDAALLEDLAWLRFEADLGPVRQSDTDEPYAAALATLRSRDLVYACECSRAMFEESRWARPGCPSGCRSRALTDRPGLALRVALGGGDETWMDGLAGPLRAPVATHGDIAIRDRHGNWTYPFAVVVDDLRQGVDLVVRGHDLLDATAPQIRLGRTLGREEPPAFVHHRLVRKPSGAKLSKADGDTSVRELRASGLRPEELIGRAAMAVGLIAELRDVSAGDVGDLVR